jgi:hypothetical protein
VVQSYELSNLFQNEESKAFGRSVSSIHWRSGPAYIRSDQKTLLITVKSGGEFLFGLEPGISSTVNIKKKPIGVETQTNQGNGCLTAGCN